MNEWGFTAGNSVISRYVESLYEVAVKLDQEKIVAKQLRLIKDYICNIKNYDKFLKKISYLSEQGENFVIRLISDLKLSKEVGNFLKLLLKNNRITMIIDVCEAYFAYLDKINGKKIFYFTLANKNIERDSMKKFESELHEVFGEEIECVTKIDSSLIDGFKLQYQSKILDYSLQSRFNRLNNAIRRENYEN